MECLKLLYKCVFCKVCLQIPKTIHEYGRCTFCSDRTCLHSFLNYFLWLKCRSGWQQIDFVIHSTNQPQLMRWRWHSMCIMTTAPNLKVLCIKKYRDFAQTSRQHLLYRQLLLQPLKQFQYLRPILQSQLSRCQIRL